MVVANGAAERARGEAVSGDYFAVLGLQPAAGRLLQAGDDRRGGPAVAVIDERMWRRRFDSRPDIAGRVIRMGGREFEIVGVAPAGFHGVVLPNLARTEVWVPLQHAAIVHALGAPVTPDTRGDLSTVALAKVDRDQRWLLVQGRLAPGGHRTGPRGLSVMRAGWTTPNRSDAIFRASFAPVRLPALVALPAADRLLTGRRIRHAAHGA